MGVCDGTSVSGRSFDNNGPFVSAATDVEVIARADHSARLRTSALQRNFAARYRLSGKRPCFEKTRRPKPLIDSDFNLLGMPIVHNVGAMAKRSWAKYCFQARDNLSDPPVVE